MKLHKLCLSTIMLFATQVSYAHTQSGALGSAATATDIYNVTCSNDGSGPPAKLGIQVSDLAPVAAPTVSVSATKGTLSASSADPKDGDNVYSTMVYVSGGAGVYVMKVFKNAAGAESYSAQFHCMTSGNIHTGTTIGMTQNQ